MSALPDQGRDKATKRVIEGLKRIYKDTILPLEQVCAIDLIWVGVRVG